MKTKKIAYLGLLIALLLNEKFPGVRFLRSIIIIPWAIPTVVNGSLWKLIFNGEYGVFNALLLQAGVIDAYQSWLGNPKLAMLMIIIADTWKMTPLAVIFFLILFSDPSISGADCHGHYRHAYGGKIQSL